MAGVNEWTSQGPFGGDVAVVVVDPATVTDTNAFATCGFERL